MEQSTRADPLKRFLLSVLLWLPVCFGAWYYLSILFTAPLASIVEALMTWTYPAVIERVAQDGNELIVLTHLVASVSAERQEALGTIFFEINPLKYGYCAPLYTALVLATPGEDGVRAIRWIGGMLILLAVQVFGISTEILKVLAFQVNEEAREMLGGSAWGFAAIGLAYQLGFLILPSVAPIVIWFGQFQDGLTDVIGQTESDQIG